MTIEWLRDLVIIVSSILMVVLLASTAIIAFLLYRKIRPIMESIKEVAATAEEIASCAKELAKPIIIVASLIKGFRRGAKASSNFKKKGDKDEQG